MGHVMSGLKSISSYWDSLSPTAVGKKEKLIIFILHDKVQVKKGLRSRDVVTE